MPETSPGAPLEASARAGPWACATGNFFLPGGTGGRKSFQGEGAASLAVAATVHSFSFRASAWFGLKAITASSSA